MARWPETLEQRFWKNVNVRPTTDECWLWQGPLRRDGYAGIRAFGSNWLAHRVAYALVVSSPERELTLDHLCRNKACVNPWHLEQVTLKANILRGGNACARWARTTQCPRGHERGDANRYRGDRSCLTCKRQREREASKRYRKRKRIQGCV